MYVRLACFFQVVGIGNAGVGKTCLIKHFCESKVNINSVKTTSYNNHACVVIHIRFKGPFFSISDASKQHYMLGIENVVRMEGYCVSVTFK